MPAGGFTPSQEAPTLQHTPNAVLQVLPSTARRLPVPLRTQPQQMHLLEPWLTCACCSTDRGAFLSQHRRRLNVRHCCMWVELAHERHGCRSSTDVQACIVRMRSIAYIFTRGPLLACDALRYDRTVSVSASRALCPAATPEQGHVHPRGTYDDDICCNQLSATRPAEPVRLEIAFLRESDILLVCHPCELHGSCPQCRLEQSRCPK